MARHPVWTFAPSLIFRSLALSYKLGNKRGENVRKLGQNMSGNCQECQEFSTLQKSGHSETDSIIAHGKSEGGTDRRLCDVNNEKKRSIPQTERVKLSATNNGFYLGRWN